MNDTSAATMPNPDFPGISTITVTYDGSGDSGGIESTTAYTATGDEVELSPAQSEFVEERCYALMPSGFENNEGGFGDITIDIAANRMSLNHSDRYDESESKTIALGRERQARIRAALGADFIKAAQGAGAIELHCSTDPNGTSFVLLDLNGRQVTCADEDDATERLTDHLAAAFAPPSDEDADFIAWTVDMPLVQHPRCARLRSPALLNGLVEIQWSVPNTAESCESDDFDPLKPTAEGDDLDQAAA